MKLEPIELGSVLQVAKGKKPARQSEKREEGFLPYVDIQAFEQGTVSQYTDGEKCLPCEDGDILIVCDGARSGLVGRAIKGYVGSTLALLKARGVCNSYLFHFIAGKYASLNTKMKGTGTPHLNMDVLKKQKMVVPSIEEQERIVNRIEELFSEIDNAVSSLKTVKQKLAAFQQIITEHSFAELNEETTLLGNHLLKIESGKSFKCEERPPKSSECGIVKVSAVTWGRFQQLESKTCKPEQFVEKRRICKGDFLFSRANTIQLIGNCVIVDEIEKKLMLSDKILRFSFDESLLPDFALLYLRSGTAKKQIRSFSSGNQDGMRNISQDKIRKITIPLPPILLQEKIVESVNQKIDACKKLEIQINDALIRAEKLKQSILKKAFEGELL